MPICHYNRRVIINDFTVYCIALLGGLLITSTGGILYIILAGLLLLLFFIIDVNESELKLHTSIIYIFTIQDQINTFFLLI